MDDHARWVTRLGARVRAPGRLLVGLLAPGPSRSLLARVAAGVATVSTVGLLLAAAPRTPPLAMEQPANPPVNIMPVPNVLSSGAGHIVDRGVVYDNPCITPESTWPVFSSNRACTDYVLLAINNARVRENALINDPQRQPTLAPMVLPSNWDSLSVPEQMLVATNLERVARGYPPYLGLNAALNHEAAAAALKDDDPRVANGFAVGFNALGTTAFGGSWSEGYNVLLADYFMFYADGWGGSRANTANIACLSAGDPGCWAHRDELLGNAPNFNPGVGLWCDTCEFGAGFTTVDGHSSYAQLVEMPAGAPPPMTFTWQSEVPFFPDDAIGPVKTVSLARVSFRASSLRARWSVTGVQNASAAVVYTFAGSRCSRVGRVTSFRYVPAFNIRRSTVTMTGKRYFTPRGWYSAVVRVFTPGGSLTSRCVALGRN